MTVSASDAGVVIVGAGYAAAELAIKLRQEGYARPITMIGTETHLPYQRPPLSKSFLAGTIEKSALLLRPESTYQHQNISFRGGITVRSIDRASKSVLLGDDERLPYDALVLATGGHARRMSCPGSDLSGIFALRTLDDVELIRANTVPGRRLVLIGGGYIGLEVAAVAVKKGLSVTVVEAAPRLLARVTGPEISAFYAEAHRAAGVVIRTEAGVVDLRAKAGEAGAVGAVVLGDGSIIDADFVIAGIGLIPHTELAEAAGLAVSNGILVDEYCRTEDPSILAIGDCSNHPSLFLGRRIRLESIPNALEQARVAAATITGALSAYDAIPWFWSDQYDLKLQAVGLVEGHDQVVLRGVPSSRSFVAFYLRGGRVIAADSVNRTAEFMVAKRMVADGLVPDPALLADDTIKLKTLMAAKAA